MKWSRIVNYDIDKREECVTAVIPQLTDGMQYVSNTTSVNHSFFLPSVTEVEYSKKVDRDVVLNAMISSNLLRWDDFIYLFSQGCRHFDPASESVCVNSRETVSSVFCLWTPDTST